MRRLNPDIFNKWVYEGIADYSNRIEVYMGGAGSGKSYGATQKVLLKALKSKRRVLVIRKIQNTIKHSIWALIPVRFFRRYYIYVLNGSEKPSAFFRYSYIRYAD